MKNTLTKLSLLFLLFVLCKPTAYTQITDTATIWTITTMDGNEYFGTIVTEDSIEVQLKTKTLGVINIPVRQIVHKEKIDKKNLVLGEFWFENPQATRYFWGPNGYGLKKGEAYFQNIWILANQASYGFTDHFTLGLGTVPVFLFGVSPEYSPFWITPKVSIPVVSDQLNLGFGAFLGGISSEGYGGLLYGSITGGSRDNNVSLNVGYGVLDGEWSRGPTLSLSFMKRVSRRTYLLSENYYIGAGTANVGLISFGARTVWNKISLDYGLVVPIIEDEPLNLALPWLGFSIPMGKLRRGN